MIDRSRNHVESVISRDFEKPTCSPLNNDVIKTAHGTALFKIPYSGHESRIT